MISQASAQQMCPRCAQPLTAGARACGSCGALLLAYTPLQPGQPLDGGRYTIRRILSNSGTIALATDHLTFDRAVVIKAILDGFDPSDPSQLQASRARFLQETQTLATLQHLAIPHLFGSFQDGPHNYIVVEYVEGQDLRHRLTRIDPATGAHLPGQAYDRQDVLRWGVALCQALEYLAGRQPQPVLHQDIKPANLVIDSSSGNVRLVDFGASRARPEATNGPAVVHRLVLMGTHGYAAPEQYTGQSEPRSDVYALAATLYHLATDDDPRGHPFEFPHLARLGLLGQALEAALQLDVAARLTAVDLRRRLEGIVGAATTQPIQTPDGIELRDMPALANWCELHWSQGSSWLAGALPEQIERLWGKFRLAQQLRDLQQQHGDAHTTLDAALALMDPAGFGRAQPRLAYAWPAIDFGPRAAGDQATYSMRLTNPGRRAARAQIDCPSWISVSGSHVILAPRQSVGVTFYANLRGVATFGQLRDNITFRDGTTTLLTVEARTTVSRWRTLWRRYPGRVIAAMILILVLIGAGYQGYWAGYKAWHYHAGVAALEQGDWLEARAEIRKVLATEAQYVSARASQNNSAIPSDAAALALGAWVAMPSLPEKIVVVQETYRDTALLLKESYYRPALAAIQAGQWEQAAEAIVALEALDDAYRDLPQLIAAHSELSASIRRYRAQVWQSGRIQMARKLPAAGDVYAVAWSPDGQLLAFGGSPVRLWQVTDGQPARAFAGADGAIYAIAFAPDGRTLAAAGDDHNVYLWRVADGLLLKRLAGHTQWITGLAWNPDGGSLASSSVDGKVNIWRASDGALVQPIAAHEKGVMDIAWSPDGETLASADPDDGIKLWRARDGKLSLSLSPGAKVRTVVFSPDGQILASGDWRGRIDLWRVSDGSLIQSVMDYGSLVESIAFSPDGQTLASAGDDREIKLWRVSDGRLLQSLRPEFGAARNVAFSSDGRFLASGGQTGNYLQIWRPSP